MGSQGIIPTNAANLQAALELGIDWSVREGYSWAEDKEHCEEYGRMLGADATAVSARESARPYTPLDPLTPSYTLYTPSHPLTPPHIPTRPLTSSYHSSHTPLHPLT